MTGRYRYYILINRRLNIWELFKSRSSPTIKHPEVSKYLGVAKSVYFRTPEVLFHSDSRSLFHDPNLMSTLDTGFNTPPWVVDCSESIEVLIQRYAIDLL